MTPREWAMLLVLSVIWGGSFFFNHIALRDLPVLTVVFCRVALAGAILMLVLTLGGRRMPRDGGTWAAFLAMGLLNNALPFSLIVWGQQTIALGAASILNAATPLFTVILADRLTADERMTGGRLAGVLIGLGGVAVMIGPAVLGDLGASLGAELACLGAALSYAFAGIFGRRFRRMGIDPVVTATGQVICAAVILMLLALAVDHPWTRPAPGVASILAVVGVAAISTALAYVLYFRILATAGATNLLLVTFLVPVSAILLGTLFLGETLQPRQIAGMALIGAGLVAIDGRLWRRLRPGG